MSARQPTSLTVTLGGVSQEGRFADAHALCNPDGKGQSTFGADRSPEIGWSAGPAGTRSYAVLMSDPDVPTKLDQINQAGVTIPESQPRQTIYHWVLVDIPADTTSLAEGADGDKLVPKGKPVGAAKHGTRGANDYTSFFASNAQMAGTYGGYDGPCPPWNDERVHHYHVAVYALDVPKLDLPQGFDGRQALAALQPHVLAQGEAVATYSLNSKTLP